MLTTKISFLNNKTKNMANNKNNIYEYLVNSIKSVIKKNYKLDFTFIENFLKNLINELETEYV